MRGTVTGQLVDSHLVEGKPRPGEEIGLRIDQTLTQDATGTLVMLELEALGVDRVATEVSAQYVDHNLVQEDHKNPDDHLFLHSASQKWGVWFSRAGNGVSHPVHQAHFGEPGRTLLGSDSHTPAAGAMGMLAFGAGGVEVAMAMVGEPYRLETPEVWGVRLEGRLPDWVSAKDVILEMLRRHGVHGAVGCVLEYHGPGLAFLSAMDRHVIANMGAELGATSSVFPSDDETRRFLADHGREDAWRELRAEDDARFDRETEIDLARLEPLIAMPSSPDKVVPVGEVAGAPIGQAYVGSSANPGFRDFAVAAEIVRGKQIPAEVSFDVNPTSRGILRQLVASGHVGMLLAAGARLHQAGCNGCIGMGQAPATDTLSLRTVPRNFPGRSGTREDKVCLVSPETAAASALAGKIADPRTLGGAPPRIESEPPFEETRDEAFVAPLDPDLAREVELRKGPNIVSLPDFDPLPESFDLPVLLVVGDNLSTDGILPAGARVLPYRSNVPRIAEFAFEGVDETYPERAKGVREAGGHAVVAGENYGQGSSREHAALAPRFLGLRLVLAKSFARIHRQNLVNFGVLPLRFEDPDDYDRLSPDDRLSIDDVHGGLAAAKFSIRSGGGATFAARHDLSSRERDIVRAGGILPWWRDKQ